MQAAASLNRPPQLGEQWVGQNVDGRYPLLKCLSSADNRALFLTQIGGEQGANAVIKLVLAGSGDPEAQLALWRRAAKLSHANLLRILDGGRCWLNGHDLVFLVSECAEENLGEVLPRRPLTTAECNALLRPMIAVLKHIHAQGMVHGRLKPSNVMAVNEQLKVSSDCIRPGGEVRVSGGSSAYDAPELKTGKISSAADVWSLGAILSEALSLKSVAQNGAQKNLPKPFAEIIRHCLREDPTSRWTLDQIEACLEGSVIAAPRHGSPAGESLRRYLPAILAAVLLLIVIAIYGLLHGGNRPPATIPATATKPNAAPAPLTAPTASAPSAAAQPSASTAGAVLHEVPPAASPSSLRTIHGRIKVRVRVETDAAGNVTAEKLVTAGPSRYFSRLAMQAAQQWKFTPDAKNAGATSSQWTILFEFTRSGISQQASLSSR
jgi:TonB family protein